MVNKWICTDPDCAQYSNKLDDMAFAYTEIREYDDRYITCYALIFLREYTFDEIAEYCRAYYNSLEQIVRDYGFKEAFRIMAECIFEQLPSDAVEYVIHDTYEQAESYIKEVIIS